MPPLRLGLVGGGRGRQLLVIWLVLQIGLSDEKDAEITLRCRVTRNGETNCNPPPPDDPSGHLHSAGNSSAEDGNNSFSLETSDLVCLPRSKKGTEHNSFED